MLVQFQFDWIIRAANSSGFCESVLEFLALILAPGTRWRLLCRREQWLLRDAVGTGVSKDHMRLKYGTTALNTEGVAIATCTNVGSYALHDAMVIAHIPFQEARLDLGCHLGEKR